MKLICLVVSLWLIAFPAFAQSNQGITEEQGRIVPIGSGPMDTPYSFNQKNKAKETIVNILVIVATLRSLPDMS